MCLGLVKLVDRKEIEAADWSLTPGRYVGVAPAEPDEDFDFEAALRDIHVELASLNEEAAELARRFRRTLRVWGYEVARARLGQIWSERRSHTDGSCWFTASASDYAEQKDPVVMPKISWRDGSISASMPKSLKRRPTGSTVISSKSRQL